MQSVSYGGESFVTSDDGAAALLEFAASAAMSGVGEVVALPSVQADGSVVSVSLVIGPSSELMTTPVETLQTEPDTREAAAVLRVRASELRASNLHAHGSAIAGPDLGSTDPATDDAELY